MAVVYAMAAGVVDVAAFVVTYKGDVFAEALVVTYFLLLLM